LRSFIASPGEFFLGLGSPMNDQPELPSHVPLVVATRGGLVESVHYGSIAVVDAGGALLAGVGDAAFPVFTRSTLKPFQALPFVADGGPVRFGFSAEQVALLCASHSGEPRQVAAVADMLARAGCDERDLGCGVHPPLFFDATRTPVPPDFEPTPLHHNCSGKHAGFLAWCRLHDAPLDGYLDPVHPLQRAIRRSLATLFECDEGEFIAGTDGCSAPNYAIPLARLACAYARLVSDGRRGGGPLGVIFRAMTEHPDMVSGEGRGDLLLAQAGRGDWLAKAGAEGVQAIGVASRGIGLAVKIADGGARSVRVATRAALAQLGPLPRDAAAVLRAWGEDEIRNYAGIVTGRLVPVFLLG